MGSLRAKCTAAAVVVVVAALCLPAAPATAAEAGAARLLSSSEDHYGTIGACRTWSNSTGHYGVRCAGGGRYKSYADVLQGSRPPTCWLLPSLADGPMPTSWTALPGSRAPVRNVLAATADPTEAPTGTAVEPPTGGPTNAPTDAPTGDPVSTPTTEPAGEPVAPTAPPAPEPTPTTAPPQDFVKVCLSPEPSPTSLIPPYDTGVDTSTVTVSVDDPGRLPFWWELSPGQRAYATRTEGAGAIAEGTLSTSPSTTPRIGQVVAFSVDGAQGPLVRVGDTLMRAELESLTIDTGQPGSGPVTCEGPGREIAAGTQAKDRTGPGICSFRFEQTSSGRGTLAPDTYDVVATEHWEIEVSVDAGATWVLDRAVDLQARTGLRVTEVQTLVVPLPS